MNLPCAPEVGMDASQLLAFKMGHKQARHAAAELSLVVEAQNEALHGALSRLLKSDKGIASATDAELLEAENNVGVDILVREQAASVLQARTALVGR